MTRHAAAAVTAALTLAAAVVALKQTTDTPLRAPPEPARFLARYVEGDGRVVRRDGAGDTVSEGQAYAMLLAAAIGDEETFRRVWRWTRAHLRRADGLLSWLWREGRVTDAEPASDADLDAARALLVASRRFGDRSYEGEARRLAGAILREETVSSERGPVLVAGPWARRRNPPVVNPSYFSPRAYDDLGAATSDARWADLSDAGREMLSRLLGDGRRLPPDWALLGEGGELSPAGDPNKPGSQPRFGADAARIPVRLAESCEGADRALAAELWPVLRDGVRRDGLTRFLRLDGGPAEAGNAPAALVGAAGAADAAKATDARDDLLRDAAAADARDPRYYGAAWVALGRVMLTTQLLGGCS